MRVKCCWCLLSLQSPRSQGVRAALHSSAPGPYLSLSPLPPTPKPGESLSCAKSGRKPALRAALLASWNEWSTYRLPKRVHPPGLPRGVEVSAGSFLSTSCWGKHMAITWRHLKGSQTSRWICRLWPCLVVSPAPLLSKTPNFGISLALPLQEARVPSLIGELRSSSTCAV